MPWHLIARLALGRICRDAAHESAILAANGRSHRGIGAVLVGASGKLHTRMASSRVELRRNNNNLVVNTQSPSQEPCVCWWAMSVVCTSPVRLSITHKSVHRATRLFECSIRE